MTAMLILGIVFCVLAGLMVLLIPAGVLALLVLSATGSILLGGVVFLVAGVLAVLRMIF